MKHQHILLLVGAILARVVQWSDGATFLATATAQQDTCRFLPHEGVIRTAFRRARTVTARSVGQCALKSCRCTSRCVASFYPASGLCIASAPLFEILNLKDSNNFIQQTPGGAPITYEVITNNLTSDLKSPSGLWLFDSESKGRNFGSKGRLLDIPFNGSKWIVDGPRDNKSSLKYPDFKDYGVVLRTAPYILGSPSLRIEHNGTYLLNFTRPFSIATWVRIPVDDERPRHNFPFTLACLEGDYIRLAVRERPPYHDQLQFFANDFAHYSVLIERTRLEWMHIAAVYKGPGNAELYMNGGLLGINETVYDDISSFNWGPSREISILFRDMRSSSDNSIACLAIYERALSWSQVSDLMQKCP